MSNNFVDVLVIGGGVVGLAIAKTFAAERRDVLVVERENTFGSVTSSRNSGVIHAGVYYDQKCFLTTLTLLDMISLMMLGQQCLKMEQTMLPHILLAVPPEKHNLQSLSLFLQHHYPLLFHISHQALGFRLLAHLSNLIKRLIIE